MFRIFRQAIKATALLALTLACAAPALPLRAAAETSDVTATHLTVPFEDQLESWEGVVKRAEDDLHEHRTEPDEIKALREALRKARSEAGDAARTAEEELRTQKQLLSTLGAPAPEAPDGSGPVEERPVKEKRTNIEKAIASADSRAKQAALVITKINEILDRLLEFEQTEQKRRLLTRQINFWDISYYGAAFTKQRAAFSELFALHPGKLAAAVSYVTATGSILAAAIFLFTWRAGALLQQNGTLYRRPRTPLLAGCAGLTAALVKMREASDDALLSFDSQMLVAALMTALLSLLMQRAVKTLAFAEEGRAGKWRAGAARLSGLFLGAAVASVALGYIHLGAYIVVNVTMSYTALSVFVALRTWVDRAARKNDDPAKRRRGLSPLGIALIEPVLAAACLLIPLYFLGLDPADIYDWFSRYQEGFALGSVRIHPLDIVLGGATFFLLLALTKFFQWFFSRRIFPHTRLDAGVRNAAVTMVGYLGGGLATLSLLGTLGINMSNLAIVAGAFSVGIGFGLQSIFSNFVSGVILLLERPVRVGDWVSVGAVEGTIKKIRVRSTSIETFQHADVIVPNTMLITEVVQNWTLDTLSGRVDVQVGVDYGADPELVSQILFDIVRKQPQALAYPEPAVLLTGFGASAMNFEARVFIRDIRDRGQTASAIRKAIWREFRARGVTIPVTLHEVTIRYGDKDAAAASAAATAAAGSAVA